MTTFQDNNSRGIQNSAEAQLLEEEDNGLDIDFLLKIASDPNFVPPAINGSGVIEGDIYPLSFNVEHDFKEETVFPDLKERVDIKDIDGGGTANLSVAPDGLNVKVETVATIKMVESGAGYNNTLGAYTIGEDGTIKAVEFAYTNVKDPLNANKSELKKIDSSLSKLGRTVSGSEKKIDRYEKQIDGQEARIEKLQAKIDEINLKDTLSRGDLNRIASYERQIDKSENRIEQFQKRISSYETRIGSANDKILDLNASKEVLLSENDGFSYTIDSNNGNELGLFIIANGDRINKEYKNLDLTNGELRFVYNLGQDDERLAKITDSAENISLIHVLGETVTVLQGNIYHSTERGASTAINPDDAEHAVSGLVDSDDPSTLRVGFEDLKNLGDADFNDVVFDLTIETQTIELPETLLNDIINGSDLNDNISSGAGDDVVNAFAGNDTVDAGTGDDEVFGGEGFDLLRGGEGEDILHGGGWTDTLVGNLGNDTLYGDDGNDFLNGDEGDDLLDGGNDDDQLNGNDGNDTLNGGQGNDILGGDAGDDTLSGGTENDLLNGDDGNDILNGDEGDDRLFGDAGDDTVSGGSGNDNVYGNDGNDVVNGDEGSDNVIGGDGNDTLNGGADTDNLFGEDGDDILLFGEGADLLRGQAGADTFKAYETVGLDNDMAFALDFSEADGDTIDITALLSQFDAGTDNISDYVNVAQGFNTTIQVDRDGAGTEFGWDNVLRLQGNTTLETDVETLVTDGTLIV